MLQKKIDNIKVPNHSICMIWLGGGSYILKTEEGKIIYIDPYLSDSGHKILGMLDEPPGNYKRMVKIPIDPKNVKADYVICTHDHVDHLDPWSIPIIADANPNAGFIGPYSCCYHYLELRVSPDNVIEFNGKDSINIDGINLTAFLTFHLKDSISFYMSVNDINMCFLSDAAYSAALVKEVIRDYHKYQPIDILIIAANGKSGNLDTKNCLSLTDKIRPKILIPMHYGMFKETHSDPKIVTRAVKESSPDVKTVIIGFKESYIYSKF